MEGESGVTRNIIDEVHSSDIERDQIHSEKGFTRNIIDEFHSWDLKRDRMVGESGVTRSIIDELHSSDMLRDQMDGEMVLLGVSLMNFILRICYEIKWTVKVV